MPTRTPRAAAVAATAAAAALASLFSATATAARAAEAAPPKPVVTQVDGMTNRVLDQLWENTDHYWHEGDYNRIVALIRVVMEGDPSDYEAPSSGAWLLWSMGDKPAANALLARSVAISPRPWVAHYAFGEQLFIRREYKDAIPHLQVTTKYPKVPSSAWKMLAHSYDKTGQYQKSLDCWQTVVKRFPDDVAGPPNLRRLQAKVSSKAAPKPAGA
jgi:tetratricopeptide (TPR) repeat protein